MLPFPAPRGQQPPALWTSVASRLRRSIVVGSRSVLGPLSDGKPWFPIGHRHSKRGARKYYLHSPQPESGRCGLQVILLDFEKREKFENKLLREPPGPPETADLGGSAQASMLLLVGFAFLRSGSYQKPWTGIPGLPRYFLIVFCASLYAP